MEKPKFRNCLVCFEKFPTTTHTIEETDYRMCQNCRGRSLFKVGLDSVDIREIIPRNEAWKE